MTVAAATPLPSRIGNFETLNFLFWLSWCFFAPETDLLCIRNSEYAPNNLEADLPYRALQAAAYSAQTVIQSEEFARIISPLFPPFQASDEAAALNEESHAAPNNDYESVIVTPRPFPDTVTTSGLDCTSSTTKRAIFLNDSEWWDESERQKKNKEKRVSKSIEKWENAFQETKFLLKKPRYEFLRNESNPA